MRAGKQICRTASADRPRRMTGLRALLAVPAVLMLAASPLSASPSHLLLVPMCTAEGPRLVPLGDDRDRGPDDRRGHGQIACAHALCPRELLPGRKARGVA